ncbi:MalY/PatB family protein [Christensenella minuta]|uniref:MalY/PatB family protein n=1 Tax=Christensenella minuta TaxID=626937 RepID=UPI0021577F35|nr:MalY/PatB family protein [Christensenella minuta]MDY3751861.1 MalY/PatB family protein [Christensenella minuta]
MKYDFETCIDKRNSGSVKWRDMLEKQPDVPEGVVPLSVADMEFKTAPEITAGLKEYIETQALGYTEATDTYYDAVAGWMKDRHGWDVKREWIVTTPGIVLALGLAVRAFTQPGEGVIIMTPVYYPFYMVVEKQGRKLAENELKNRAGRYEIDFDGLEKKAEDPNNRMLLLCSPHNPVGRVWTREELARVSEICARNGVLVVADEIHHDLIMPGYSHTVFTQAGDPENVIVCTAPSKTFNLAGMQVSNIIIPNEGLRRRFRNYKAESGLRELGALSYRACELAYTRCAGWLNGLLAVLDENRRLTERFAAQELGRAHVTQLEGTYLQWIDLRAYGLTGKELERKMLGAHLFLDEGYIFGKTGAGFERINIACPSRVLEEALSRMKDALEK